MPDEAPILELRGVYFAYPGGVEALRGVDLDLHRGERVALLGENGSGKTTLARLLLGLLRPTKGTVRVNGVDGTRASSHELARWVGLSFQNPDHQIFERTVADEVAFGPRNYGLSAREVEGRVDRELKRFCLEDHRHAPPTFLSGGERKQVAFASTFALDPAILLLDEPTKGMDYGRKRRLAAVLDHRVKEGRTVVVITHDIEFAYASTERAVVLQGGQVLTDGPTAQVLADPRVEEAGLCRPALVRLATLVEGAPRAPRSVEEILRALEVMPSWT